MRFIATNARSLAPKISSLMDCFNELDLHFAIVTESWLRDGKQLDAAIVDLNAGCNLDMVTHNRKAKSNGRTAGGGIAIVYNKGLLAVQELKIRRGRSEIVCAAGKLPGQARRVVIIGIYLPPRLKAEKRKEALGCLRDAIAKAKIKYKDPYIVIAGDTNKMSISDGIEDYPDIKMNIV